MTIREVDPERDADGVVALSRASTPTIVISPASWRHRVATVPERARRKGWVAEDDGAIVASAYGLRNFFTEGSTTGWVSVDVDSSHRGRGLGSKLFELVDDHVCAIGATSQMVMFFESDAGVAFARARGFHEVRAEVESTLDPRAVSERPPADVDLRRVADVDPTIVYRVDMEVTQDVPATEPVDHMPYDEWEQHVLAHPLFAPDGSFVAMADGEAAAVSLLIVDDVGRATSMFTGTRRHYRGRGLARAVKLASIEWAAANGVTQLVTTNDETNAPMLAINRRLGYRPAGRRVEYLLNR
ncbi:MAG: GNAT family N-acetyltransferase [Gaiellaceae bacterium]